MEGAKYRLGKLKNKYLILEILSYSFHAGAAAKLLHDSSSNLRYLFTKNYEAFKNIITNFETLLITYFS